MTKQYPAVGFLDRLKKISQDKGITLAQLAEIVHIEPVMFQYYDLGEIPLDEMTLHRILN
jgi:hypothetical protein